MIATAESPWPTVLLVVGGLCAVAAAITWLRLSLPRLAGARSRRRRWTMEIVAGAMWVAAGALFWCGGSELIRLRPPGDERASGFYGLVACQLLFGGVVGVMASLRIVTSPNLASWGAAGGLRAIALLLLVIAFAAGGCWTSTMLPLLLFG